MVMVFSGFVVVFTDNALGTALIQRRGLIEGDRSTVFWMSAGVGLVLTLVGSASPCRSATSTGSRPSARCSPRLDQLPREFSRDDPGGTARARDAVPASRAPADGGDPVGAAPGITIALAGLGAWAIVGQQLAEAATRRCSSVVADAVATLVRVLDREPPAARRLRRQRLRARSPLSGGPDAEHPSDRPRAGCGLARHVRACDERDPDSVLANRGASAAGLLSGVLALNDDRERIADIWIRATRLVG